jgi:hypothetical protein
MSINASTAIILPVIRLQSEIPRVVDPYAITRLNAVRHCEVRAESQPDRITRDGTERNARACVRAAREHEIVTLVHDADGRRDERDRHR